MALYYVPAPAKRGALYRDWIVMALCRPFFPQLILHWHAAGLGQWLETSATKLERRVTKRLLGKADLALVLAPELAGDIAPLSPKRIAIVQNALTESGVLPTARQRANAARYEILYIGLCSAEKGFFDTLEAVALLHSRAPGSFRLTIAGGFDSAESEARFRKRANDLTAAVRHVGFVDAEAKRALFNESDLFCFPTYYPHEGQPLVLIEALAHDLPIVTTKWRAIPGMLPRKYVWFVDPGRPDQIATAISQARQAGDAKGILREHYLLNFTPAQHLDALKKALFPLEG
jgi:glycosyltransferase involved in cell wall biosynthesis